MPTNKLILPNRLSPLKRLNGSLKRLNNDGSRKYFILTDENVLEHCLPTLVCNVTEFENAEFMELPAGESCKEAEIAIEVWKSLNASGADRNSIIVNLGGGCVCDVGGFIAATYRRGIDFVNIPTTLTAMVDAAIGGKTAINLDKVKNQVGCYRNPVITCIEPAFLDTLPDRELRSGEYEIMKSLLLTGREDWPSTFAAKTDYAEQIAYCVEFKQSVVKADPEEKGIRKILNFGHTFGHALETYGRQHDKNTSHGEAVGVGMMYALYLSVKKLGCDSGCYRQYRSWLTQRIEPQKLTLKEIEEILGYMHLDKKRQNGETLCVLLKAPGVPVIDVPVSDNEVRDAILSSQR